jgi:signal transduction histidine kinase
LKHAAAQKTISPLILVVEDSKVVQVELKLSIEAEFGFQVVAVATYEEAREFLNWHVRDIFLAILDLHLPDSHDGEIVDLFCSMSIPSIVFTSDFTEGTRERMQSKDIIDYVVKDVHAVSNIIGYIRRLDRNRGKKVLVVEDSEAFRLYLSSLLHRQMFQVEDFPDGESAAKYIENDDDVALVIIDYVLPGMDGIELTQFIRARYSKEQLVVIGLSSVSDPMLTARYIKNGANDFITKPFELETFFSRVNHHVDEQESIRALKEANEVKNQFLGMAVHDLRSPINGIHGLTQMMLDGMCGNLTEEQLEMIGFISEAADQMNSLVGDLLDISVIESGQLNLNKTLMNLSGTIEQRLRIQALIAKKKSIDFKVEYRDLQDFYFDAGRVGQVLDNLISNAIKFSPPQSVIEISVSEEEGNALVCVTDHGQGIPPDESELLFQSFSKTSVQPTAGESSTGLGLPIVQKIIQAHGGRVWAESEYGHGATFCFTLPMSELI